jgi:hypothetical protein
VAETHIPVINLIRQRTAKEEVEPDIIEEIDHNTHAAVNNIFLLTLSTISPMKIPATE